MRNKRKMIALLTSICTVFSCVPAYALDMDLSYSYKTESKDEFVIVGEPHLNYNGEIPDYLRDIFDITPQMAYDSQYGSNIIEPDKPVLNHTTYAPRYAPSGGFTQSPSRLISGSIFSRWKTSTIFFSSAQYIAFSSLQKSLFPVPSRFIQLTKSYLNRPFFRIFRFVCPIGNTDGKLVCQFFVFRGSGSKAATVLFNRFSAQRSF